MEYFTYDSETKSEEYGYLRAIKRKAVSIPEYIKSFIFPWNTNCKP